MEQNTDSESNARGPLSLKGNKAIQWRKKCFLQLLEYTGHPYVKKIEP